MQLLQCTKNSILMEKEKMRYQVVSYWYKQDEIHQGTHVHKGPAFSWHRELCNRFEDLLREYDKRVSLHYWNGIMTLPISESMGNIRNLFTNEFMGNVNPYVDDGQAGDPWLKNEFVNTQILLRRSINPIQIARKILHMLNPF